MNTIRKIAVHWPRFGPYHIARLQAANSFLVERGVELVGLETAGTDEMYAWQREDAVLPFSRAQVFPGSSFETVRPREMHRRVTEALDQIQPDAVAISSYSFPDARACLAWCRRNRRVAVLMTDTREDDVRRHPLREAVKKAIASQFDSAFISGTPHQRYFEKLGMPSDVIVQGCSVVDNAYFASGASSRPELNLPDVKDDQPFFLASNRFIRRKNLDTLIRAYAAYRQHAQNPWPLVLLGDGPERAALERLIAEEGVMGVAFAGFRQIEELPAYYARATAFIHPALSEQWGLVVNEAMAASLPVVVSRGVGCAEDLVTHGENGLLFDPYNPSELTAHLTYLATHDDQRRLMGEAAARRIASWNLSRFAEGLWDAVQRGSPRSNRGLDLLPSAILRLLLLAASRPNSFHKVEA